MPIYTVRAFDGKTLQVQAADENGVAQAMQDYQAGHAALPKMPMAQGTQPQVPTGMANGIQGTPQGPNLTPGQALNNPALAGARDVLRSATPIGPIGDLQQNMGQYGQHPVQTALDVASLGANLIPGLGEGTAGIKALAGGMAGTGAATAGLDAAGVTNPLLRAGAQMAGGIGGAGTANALQGIGAFTPNAEAQALKSAGGQPTLAQSVPQTGVEGAIGKGLGAFETMDARTNPLLMGKFGNIDAANANAVRNIAESDFGHDILTPQSAVNTGNALRGQLETMAAKRAEDYAPMAQELKNAPGFPNYGNSLIKGLNEQLQNGDRPVLDDTREAFMDAAQKALGGKTDPMSVDKALTGLRLKFASKFAGITDPAVNNQIQGDFGYMMGQLKDAHYDALNRLSSTMDEAGNITPGTLGDQMREAKGDYATASREMNPLVRAVQSRNLAPENIGQGVLSSGSKGVAGVVQTPEAQQSIARSILESAKGGPESQISAARLGAALNKNRSIIPELGKAGENLGELQKIAKTAGQQDVGVFNPSLTGPFVGGMGRLAAVTQPHLWPALAADTGLGALYAYGGIPAYNAVRSGVIAAPGAAAPVLGGLSQALGAPNAR